MVATTEKKIAIRKAPVEKAGTYEEGFIATGSDDLKYIVTVDKNNIKRWMKMKTETEKPKRTYKKKVVEVVEPEPTPIVEPEPIVEPTVEQEKPEKPKRTYKKKVVEVPKEPEPIVEPTVEPEKPKRTYKKKVVEQPKAVEQETQTDDETPPTPPTTPSVSPKKERKIPTTPDKKKK